MKQKLSIVAVMLILFSCTKTDEFKSNDVSEIKIPDIPNLPRPIPKGDTTVTWSTNDSGYKVKHIRYNHFRESINQVWHGTKHITIFVPHNKAEVGDTVTKEIWAEGFRIGYIKPDSSLNKDTIIQWKTITQDRTKWITENGYGAIVNRISKDKFGNYGRLRNINDVVKIDDRTQSRTGTGFGRDKIQGDVLLWESKITEPIIVRKGVDGTWWDYPASGRVKYNLDNNGVKSVQILDYGNGRNDPFAKLTINGVTYDIVLPTELPGENEASYGDD